MMLNIAAIVIGIMILIWSSDQFVEGAASIARKLGVSQLIIGMTIVSIGTSAPEIVVSVMAALEGAGNLAVGNALGSNIANISLVLGITLLVAPLLLRSSYLNREFPLLFGVTVIGAILVVDGELDLFDGLVLLACLALALTKMARDAQKDNLIAEELTADHAAEMSASYPWLRFIGGALLLVASSRALVWGAANIADTLGVSELIIGLTIIAIGTSLPELAASVASAKKGHAEIALGNVLGSNLFNLLAVLPIPGLLAPLVLDTSVLTRDYPVMLALTALLGLALYLTFRQARAQQKPPIMGRVWGVILLLCSVCYYTALIIDTGYGL